MTDNKDNKVFDVEANLEKLLQSSLDENFDIQLLNLSTTDGFNLYSCDNFEHDVENDKLSAIVSTLGALSDSCAKQIMNQKFKITTVETESGNMLFQTVQYKKYKCVLSLVGKAELTLAKARFILNRTVDTISKM